MDIPVSTPKEREDCGYILTIAGLRIYIAGDTEDTPEVLALHDIDAAFLPVNQPYTMTVDQAVRAVKAIRPHIFYPYHYGEVDEKTDIDRLKRELEGVTDVRVFPMEWHAAERKERADGCFPVGSAHITLSALSRLRLVVTLVVKFVFDDEGYKQAETAHKEDTAGDNISITIIIFIQT